MCLPHQCQVFIGSSTEGEDVAESLQDELLSYCRVELWPQGVFEPGGYTLDSLISAAQRFDFAVLVATPDDLRESRGASAFVPRDNVILEFGLFAGILGRERTFVLATGGAQLPSDTLGLTRLAYHDKQTNPQAAVAQAARQVRQCMKRLGPVDRVSTSHDPDRSPDSNALQAEVDKLIENATTQGWVVRNTPTALRLTSPKGKTLTLTKKGAGAMREQLRPFAARARAAGLRVSDALRRPVGESPFG